MTMAYSYIRFSSDIQKHGDSLRRQTDGTAENFCKRHNLTLDTTLRMRDMAASAYTNKHATDDKYALAQFMKAVREGFVKPGSYLLVENLDRLSRAEERQALRLWMDILDSGINIVQLKPETIFRHEASDMMDIMRAIMELSRGHGESARKSQMLKDAWQNAKQLGREGKRIITRKLPAWIRIKDGKLIADPDAAQAIQTIYDLATQDHGIVAIVRHLTKQNVPAIGKSGHWTRMYVHKILNDRSVLGEFQPRFRKRGPGRGKPDGPPIPNYFPTIITEEQWLAARAGAASRTHTRTRTSKHIFLFANLITDAHGNGTYRSISRSKDSGYLYRALQTGDAIEGRKGYAAFQESIFEEAILSTLTELSPQDVLRGKHQHNRSAQLIGEKTAIEQRIAQLENELLEGDVATLTKVLRKLEQRNAGLAQEIAAERQKALHPLSESWGATKTLLTSLKTDEDRIALRTALRRIIDRIYMLVIPLKDQRLAAIQINFTGGTRRSYLILHTPARGKHRQASWEACTHTSITEFDLGNPDHAHRLKLALVSQFR